jgi:IclR family acetate operon transcriptional repressor
LVEALSRVDGPHRLADIAARAGVEKSSAHRILQDLVNGGYASSHGSGHYGAGPRLIALASEVLGGEPWTHQIASTLEALQHATTHTVHFAIRSELEVVYVQKVNADQPYQMVSRVGMHISLHCTAIGKCVLAWLGPDELASLWPRLELIAQTPKTLTTRRSLEPELDHIRRQGYAIDDEENELNVRCVAAPVFDQSARVVGGVSVSALKFQLPLEEARKIAPTVIESARQLSQSFTGSSGRRVTWSDVVAGGIEDPQF